MQIFLGGMRLNEEKYSHKEDLNQDLANFSNTFFGEHRFFFSALEIKKLKTKHHWLPDGFLLDFSQGLDPKLYLVHTEIYDDRCFEKLVSGVTRYLLKLKNKDKPLKLSDAAASAVSKNSKASNLLKGYAPEGDVNKLIKSMADNCCDILLIINHGEDIIKDLIELYKDTWAKAVQYHTIEKFSYLNENLFILNPGFEKPETDGKKTHAEMEQDLYSSKTEELAGAFEQVAPEREPAPIPLEYIEEVYENHVSIDDNHTIKEYSGLADEAKDREHSSRQTSNSPFSYSDSDEEPLSSAEELSESQFSVEDSQEADLYNEESLAEEQTTLSEDYAAEESVFEEDSRITETVESADNFTEDEELEKTEEEEAAYEAEELEYQYEEPAAEYGTPEYIDLPASLEDSYEDDTEEMEDLEEMEESKESEESEEEISPSDYNEDSIKGREEAQPEVTEEEEILWRSYSPIKLIKGETVRRLINPTLEKSIIRVKGGKAGLMVPISKEHFIHGLKYALSYGDVLTPFSNRRRDPNEIAEILSSDNDSAIEGIMLVGNEKETKAVISNPAGVDQETAETLLRLIILPGILRGALMQGEINEVNIKYTDSPEYFIKFFSMFNKDAMKYQKYFLI